MPHLLPPRLRPPSPAVHALPSLPPPGRHHCPYGPLTTHACAVAGHAAVAGAAAGSAGAGAAAAAAGTYPPARATAGESMSSSG